MQMFLCCKTVRMSMEADNRSFAFHLLFVQHVRCVICCFTYTSLVLFFVILRRVILLVFSVTKSTNWWRGCSITIFQCVPTFKCYVLVTDIFVKNWESIKLSNSLILFLIKYFSILKISFCWITIILSIWFKCSQPRYYFCRNLHADLRRTSTVVVWLTTALFTFFMIVFWS